MSNRPLYRQTNEPNVAAKSPHAGLWYDKFVDVWQGTDRHSAEQGMQTHGDESVKQRWMAKLDDCRSVGGPSPDGKLEGKFGDGEQLQRRAERLESLAESQTGWVSEFETTARFITGLGLSHPVENGFNWHHTLGTPYLPASGVKGVVRQWAAQWTEYYSDEDEDLRATSDDISRIFGESADDDHGVGSVIFFDAMPAGPVELDIDIMTPHYQEWYQKGTESPPGDWHDPTPIPFLTVAADQTFQFALAPRTDCEQDRKDAKDAAQWLVDALYWIGAGAKTAVGYGRFELK